jgi:type I restriction-modification system DNA methylase subunit
MLTATKNKIQDQHIKQNGVVYTPTVLANYVAEKVVNFFIKDLIGSGLSLEMVAKRLKKLKIIDPACGEGELLLATWQALESKVNHEKKPRLNYRNIFCGVDIDQVSIDKSVQRIKDLSASSTNEENFIATNALFPDKKSIGINEGLDSVKKRFDAQDGFDILIANPPGEQIHLLCRKFGKQRLSFKEGSV